jgi:hypothetical protein
MAVANNEQKKAADGMWIAAQQNIELSSVGIGITVGAVV